MSRKSRCVAAILVAMTLVVCATIVALPSALYFSPAAAIKDSAASQYASSESCQRRPYNDTKSPCYPLIINYQECLGFKETYIPQSVDLVEADFTFTFILGLLQPSTKCQIALVPLLCLYLFPQCNNSGVTLYPSGGYCEEISSTVCREEWNTAAAMGIESLLPQCGTLPYELVYMDRECIAEVKNETLAAVAHVYSNSTAQLQCGEDFFLYNGTCRPQCDSWETLGGVRLKIISIIGAAISIISEILFFVIIVIQWKVILTFPKVLVVYMVINLTVITTIILFVNYSDRQALFCTSPDLISSISHPSVFCNLSGAVLIYENLQLSLLWLCHVSIMFVKLTLPFHARRLEASVHKRYIHAACLTITLLLPIIPVAAMFATGGFTMATFPPFLCFPRNGDITYYLLNLPVSIVLSTGTAMLILIMWNIHKHHGLLRERQSGNTKQSAMPPLSDAERKLLLSFFYYIILGMTAVVSMSISSRNGSEVRLKLEQYFLCSGPGTVPADTCQHFKNEADALMYTYLIATAVVLVTLFPVVHLFYAISSISTLFKRQEISKRTQTSASALELFQIKQ